MKNGILCKSPLVHNKNLWGYDRTAATEKKSQFILRIRFVYAM